MDTANGQFPRLLKRGERRTPSAEYEQVPLLLLRKCDVKMDLTRKAIMCAGGHVTADLVPITHMTLWCHQVQKYATGVCIGRGQRASNMGFRMSDIGKVYVHARKTLELVFRIATASLGEEEGYIAI
jgi:hypothetical protein